MNFAEVSRINNLKCKILIIIFFIMHVMFGFSEELDSSDMEETSRVRYSCHDIPGYVYFEGFDFEGYTAESDGIEPMLSETLDLLDYYYGNNGVIGKKQPFVFVGHSQGGLRALAMSTYLRQKNPQLYKQLRGVITLSGIDKGLKLLENNGSAFRTKLHNDVQTLTNGICGVFKVFDFNVIANNPFIDLLVYDVIKSSVSESIWIFATFLLGDILDLTKGFGYPIMHNSKWNEHAQVRDMVPQSDFIKKYVLEEKSVYKQHKSKTERYLGVEWRKGLFGISYPVFVWKNKPIIIKTQEVNMKVDKNLPLTFLIGTNSNTLSLAKENVETETEKWVNVAGTVFRAGEYCHYAKCGFLIGLLTGSPVAAIDCHKAANWCGSLKYQMGELIGEQTHDGLVALSSQQLPTQSLEGTGYDTTVLNKTLKKEYTDYNHRTIAKKDEEPRKDAENELKNLLGK